MSRGNTFPILTIRRVGREPKFPPTSILVLHLMKQVTSKELEGRLTQQSSQLRKWADIPSISFQFFFQQSEPMPALRAAVCVLVQKLGCSSRCSLGCVLLAVGSLPAVRWVLLLAGFRGPLCCSLDITDVLFLKAVS